MADTTRLELATSAVTGRRSNQLSYVSSRYILYYFFRFGKGWFLKPLFGVQLYLFGKVFCNVVNVENEDYITNNAEDTADNKEPTDENKCCAFIDEDGAAEDEDKEGHNKNNEPVFYICIGEFNSGINMDQGTINNPDTDNDAENVGDFVSGEEKSDANNDGNDSPEKIVVKEIFVFF